MRSGAALNELRLNQWPPPGSASGAGSGATLPKRRRVYQCWAWFRMNASCVLRFVSGGQKCGGDVGRRMDALGMIVVWA